MLKIRIIPTLLWKEYGLVKGVGFDSWRKISSILPVVKVYNARDVDELIIVDIKANQDSRDPDYESIKDFVDECFVPLTIGGGIRNLKHIQKLLSIGADKISINTAAYSNPELIREAAKCYGSQCIVASIDVRRMPDGNYQCYSHSGKIATGKDPFRWAKELEKLGAGELLITSIERDGTMQGYDLELIKEVVNTVNVPVIASGGAGNYEDLRLAIQECGASAVAAASIYQFTQQTPAEAKKYLLKKGIPIRTNLNI